MIYCIQMNDETYQSDIKVVNHLTKQNTKLIFKGNKHMITAITAMTVITIAKYSIAVLLAIPATFAIKCYCDV